MKNPKTITKVVFSVIALVYLGISGLPSHADQKQQSTNLSHQIR